MKRSDLLLVGLAIVAIYVLTRPAAAGPSIVRDPFLDLTHHAIDPNNPLTIY